MSEQSRDRLSRGQGPHYRCQFCDYTGGGWKQGGQVCPKCGQRYDSLLAQDSEE